MPRGRKPMPTFLKLVTGNRGRRPLNENEPTPDRALPTPPAHMSVAARSELNRVARELYDLGILTNLDRTTLCSYCDAWAEYVEYDDKVKTLGAVWKTPNRKTVKKLKDGTEVIESTGGYPQQSPYVPLRNKSPGGNVEIRRGAGIERERAQAD